MKLRDLLVVLLTLFAGATSMYFWNRPPEKASRVDLSGLRAQLSAAAERGMPTPSLEIPTLPTPIESFRTVEIKSARFEVEQTILFVTRTSRRLGGIWWAQSIEGDNALVMVSVPAPTLEKFCEDIVLPMNRSEMSSTSRGYQGIGLGLLFDMQDRIERHLFFLKNEKWEDCRILVNSRVK